jgi:hypothetical protein
MNSKFNLLERLQQQQSANNAATPVQVAVEETPAASTEVLSPEVVAQIEPQPASTPVVAEVQKATPPVPSPSRTERGKKTAPAKVLNSLESLKTTLQLPFKAMITDVNYKELGDEVKVENITAVSNAKGRINVVAKRIIEEQIIELMKAGKTVLVEVIENKDYFQVLEVVSSVENVSTVEGMTFRSVGVLNQWVINGLTKEGLEINDETVSRVYANIVVIATKEGLTVTTKAKLNNAALNAATATATIGSAVNVAPAATPVATGVTATASIATTESAATGVATTTVATTATTTGK